ncbi:MAG: ABC transporter permease [Caldilineaceae bacterium]
MNIIESLRVAFRALAANKLRSILTMLGIIIGVGAVIVLISMGRGVQNYVTDQFASLGSNLLFITPGQFADGPPDRRQANNTKLLTLADMNAIGDRSRVPYVRAVTASYISNAVATRGDKDLRVSVEGVTPSYTEVRNWNVVLGSFITQADFDERGRVAVIGSKVFKDLFDPSDYPLDQTITINNILFRVIGVLEEKGGGGPGSNQDETVILPLTTAQDRLFRNKTVSGEYQANVIYASVIDKEHTAETIKQIETLMRERRNISFLSGDDFNIISQNDLISVFGDVLSILTTFLGAIAAISLLVGGIGIMNIMLVSVTERTREIGLRKAVGAKRRDVLLQFLIESISLAVFGGSIGIALGWGGAIAARMAFSGFRPEVGADAVAISFFFSMAVGLVFGIYPAFRASRLNPIDALRYE